MTTSPLDAEVFTSTSADLAVDVAETLSASPLLACDIETTGLDWSSDRIATIQLYAPGQPVAIVRVNGKVPRHVAQLLEDRRIVKLFHHAMFDLRFVARHWEVKASNVRCTKIAAKLLYPNERERQSLNALVAEHLGVRIDKNPQTSNWMARRLSKRQLQYAANDVVHLPALLDALRTELKKRDLWQLAQRCFDHIPTRVALEVGGFGDVFTY
jgi:ribonuclease D